MAWSIEDVIKEVDSVKGTADSVMAFVTKLVEALHEAVAASDIFKVKHMADELHASKQEIADAVVSSGDRAQQQTESGTAGSTRSKSSTA